MKSSFILFAFTGVFCLFTSFPGFAFCDETERLIDTPFHSTIPVLDLNAYYDPTQKSAFIEELKRALWYEQPTWVTKGKSHR